MKKKIRVSESELIRIIKKAISEDIDVTSTDWDISIKDTMNHIEKLIFDNIIFYKDELFPGDLNYPLSYNSEDLKNIISNIENHRGLKDYIYSYRYNGGKPSKLIDRLLKELNIISDYEEKKEFNNIPILQNINFNLAQSEDSGYYLEFDKDTEEYLRGIISNFDIKIKENETKGIFYVEPGYYSFNRIHSRGLIPELRGIGLGYQVYKKMIKQLGYASTDSYASNFARNIWKKIASDPDFYCIIKYYNQSNGRLLAIDKKYKGDILQLVEDFIKNDRYSEHIKGIPELNIDKGLEGILGFLSEKYNVKWS